MGTWLAGRNLPLQVTSTVSLNIKNEETHRRVRRLAELTGQTQTSAVEDAVRRRLEELERTESRSARPRRCCGSPVNLQLYSILSSVTTRTISVRRTGHAEVIVDSSALKAILAGEPDADKLNDVLSSAARPALSVANYLEAAIVLDRHRARGAGERLDRYVAVAQVEFAEVTESQVRTARAAYRNFGKGTGHPAGLNFGDWLEYALAIERDEPLLYKGDDFKQTDVRSALSA